MPIYAYRCESCGFAKDVLQKISDAPLTQCPSCQQMGFKKQLTAPSFQLKGTGWYTTDFRGGNAATTDVPSVTPPASGSNGHAETATSATTSAATPVTASPSGPASTP